MLYHKTLQADALKLVAKKLQSSLAVEGELPKDGLAAYGDDLMMDLARKIVSGEEAETETMEQAFTQARKAESAAEELLVEDGWKLVEVEQESVVVNGHGKNGNGHHDGFHIGPMVKLAPNTIHASNENGSHEEADEPQRSLLSWPEFMAEETVKQKLSRSKPQPASISLFDWALTLEQQAGNGTYGYRIHCRVGRVGGTDSDFGRGGRRHHHSGTGF